MAEKAAATAKVSTTKQTCLNSCKQNVGLHSSGSTADMILQLQRTAGNQAVQRLIKSRALQAKLRIGQPGDIYEQEADRVAEQVMRMPEPAIPKKQKCQLRSDSSCEEDKTETKTVLRKEAATPISLSNSGSIGIAVTSSMNLPETYRIYRKASIDQHESLLFPQINDSTDIYDVLRSSGQPLDRQTRVFFESRFRYDFDDVRVHTDPKATESARAINALAYTVGKDIVFEEGQYAPSKIYGKKLLAHELTHVIQQKNAHMKPVAQRWIVRGSENCLAKAVNKAKSLLEGNSKRTESAYNRWGCKLNEFLGPRKGPKLEVKYRGIHCGLSLRESLGEDLITITEGLIECCKDCKEPKDVIDAIAYTIIHETAHWCAEKHNVKGEVEHGDDVEKTLFGGFHILDDCKLKKVSSYGDKPCFSCPYKVKKGDSLRNIAKRYYNNEKEWQKLYNTNRKLIGDDPKKLEPGILLTIPQNIQRQVKDEKKPYLEGKACVKAENIPKEHSGIMRYQDLVYDNFKMEIDWTNKGASCNCGCGEYRQYVKGHAKVNSKNVEKKLFGGAKLEENIFHEDADEKGQPYGHRDFKEETNDKFLDHNSKRADRQNACSYRGIDTPGIPINKGAYLDLHLTFKGQVYDRCKDTYGKIHIWDSKYIGDVL